MQLSKTVSNEKIKFSLINDSKIIEVSNPMSENYQFVRPSIIPSLLRAESGSANAIFPHKIFEIGKVAYLCDEENTGTRTRQSLGFMTASSNANFNSAASEVSSLLYFLDHERYKQNQVFPYVQLPSN